MLAATILWKLSEYEDFVLPLLRADAAGKCAAAIEDLGPPRAGPLQDWLQVSVQVGSLTCRLFSDACREHRVLLVTLAFGLGGWCPSCRSCCCCKPHYQLCPARLVSAEQKFMEEKRISQAQQKFMAEVRVAPAPQNVMCPNWDQCFMFYILNEWLSSSMAFFCAQTRVTGVLCRIGCAASVDGPVRLRVAGALIAVVARPRGPLEVCGRKQP